VPRQLIIEGELVREVDVTVLRETRLADMMPFIAESKPLIIGRLPKSAIIVGWDETDPRRKRASFLCEVMPGVRNMRYNNRRYNISLPWTYFLFDFTTPGDPADGNALWAPENQRIYWAREQVTSLDSRVGTALIPNCDTAGGICYGTTGVPGDIRLDIRVDRLVEEFWRTTFTHDSGTGSPWQSETNSTSWARWHTESTANPNAWMTFPEWENPRQRGGGGRIVMRPLREVIGERLNRFVPVAVEGAIPPMVEPMTFGRVEEWLAQPDITPVMRHRMFTALQNMGADNPAAMEAPPVVAQIVDDAEGGMPLAPGEQ
jgi:hypothetical protein